MAVSGPRYTWPAPQKLDSARIQLRVPYHGYNRLWIVAASDGDPNSTPVVTARFYKPGKGWPLDCVAEALRAVDCGCRAIHTRRHDSDSPENLDEALPAVIRSR